MVRRTRMYLLNYTYHNTVSIFYRIKGPIVNKLSWKRFLSDHSISVYRKKLTVIAHKKNVKT